VDGCALLFDIWKSKHLVSVRNHAQVATIGVCATKSRISRNTKVLPEHLMRVGCKIDAASFLAPILFILIVGKGGYGGLCLCRLAA